MCFMAETEEPAPEVEETEEEEGGTNSVHCIYSVLKALSVLICVFLCVCSGGV